MLSLDSSSLPGDSFMVCNYQDEQLHMDQKDMKNIGYRSISTDTLDDRQLSGVNQMSMSYTTHSPNEHHIHEEIVEAPVVPDTSQAISVHSGGTTSSEAVTVSVGESRNNNSSMVSFYGKDEVVIT